MRDKVKIFIVEDEMLIVNSLKIDLETMGYWCVGHSDNMKDALQKIHAVKADIILLDININGTASGIDLANKLHEERFDASIIFLTSLDDNLTFDSTIELKPFDYLVKPTSQSRLKRTLDLCIANRIDSPERLKDEQIFIKEKNQLKRLDKSDIQFIEVKDKYCLIHCDSTKPVHVRYALKDLIKEYSLTHLFKVHRSFVVNLDKISSYDLSMNRINVNEHQIPVSKSYKELLLQRLK